MAGGELDGRPGGWRLGGRLICGGNALAFGGATANGYHQFKEEEKGQLDFRKTIEWKLSLWA